MRKKVVILTDKGAVVKPKFFPILHSKRKNVVSKPDLQSMKKIPEIYWKKDEETGRLSEMTRPEKLARLQYLMQNGDSEGLSETTWMIIFSSIVVMIYCGYQYRVWEWVING